MFLTEKQKRVYQYIRDYILKNGMAPSYNEIKENFGFRSLNAVNDHVETLVEKGYIEKGGANTKRSIVLTQYKKNTVSIPLLGTVRAGDPIDICEVSEYIDVPEEMLSGGDDVALTVKGDSMIESNICDGDVVIVKRQSTAVNGQVVIAVIDNQATIKQIYFHKDKIELRPKNPEMKPIFITADKDIQVYGTVVGLYRKYRQ